MRYSYYRRKSEYTIENVKIEQLRRLSYVFRVKLLEGGCAPKLCPIVKFFIKHSEYPSLYLTSTKHPRKANSGRKSENRKPVRRWMSTSFWVKGKGWERMEVYVCCISIISSSIS